MIAALIKVLKDHPELKFAPDLPNLTEEWVGCERYWKSLPGSATEFVYHSMYYVYILECSDKSLYTGYTNNLENRVAPHNAGKGARYASTRHLVRLAYHEEFDSKMEAMSREWHIKHDMTREEKLTLIGSRDVN